MPRPETAIKLRATLIQYLGELNDAEDNLTVKSTLYNLLEDLGEMADKMDLGRTSREDDIYEEGVQGGRDDAEEDYRNGDHAYNMRESWESAYGTVDSIFSDLIIGAKFDGPLTLDDYGLLTLSNKIVDSIKDEMDIALEIQK